MASASRRARGRFPESLADVYLWKISTAVSCEIRTRALILRPRRSQVQARCARCRATNPGAGTIIYFACDDCAVEEARVERAELRIVF
jgi:hypothetical protein